MSFPSPAQREEFAARVEKYFQDKRDAKATEEAIASPEQAVKLAFERLSTQYLTETSSRCQCQLWLSFASFSDWSRRTGHLTGTHIDRLRTAKAVRREVAELLRLLLDSNVEVNVRKGIITCDMFQLVIYMDTDPL